MTNSDVISDGDFPDVKGWISCRIWTTEFVETNL